MPDIEVVPPSALQAVIAVFLDGSQKYPMFGWRDEPRGWLTEWEANIRHQKRWMAGEDKDYDSGLPTLAHASARLLILLDNQLNERGYDNRHEWMNEVMP